MPVFSVAGWFDAYPAGGFPGFLPACDKTPNPTRFAGVKRSSSGPGRMPISRSSRTGQIDFGPQAVLEPPENLAGHNVPADLSLRWFDYWLKDVDNGMAEEGANPPLCHGRQCLAE